MDCSSKGLPASCRPMGRLSDVKPQHMLRAGALARLNVVVRAGPIALGVRLGVYYRVRRYMGRRYAHGGGQEHVEFGQGFQHLLPEQGPQLQALVIGEGRETRLHVR